MNRMDGGLPSWDDDEISQAFDEEFVRKMDGRLKSSNTTENLSNNNYNTKNNRNSMQDVLSLTSKKNNSSIIDGNINKRGPGGQNSQQTYYHDQQNPSPLQPRQSLSEVKNFASNFNNHPNHTISPIAPIRFNINQGEDDKERNKGYQENRENANYSYNRGNSIIHHGPLGHGNYKNQNINNEKDEVIFANREFLLHSTSKVNSIIQAIKLVSNHIEKEGEIDNQILSNLISSIDGNNRNSYDVNGLRSSLNSIAGILPKEAYNLDESHQEMNETIKNVLKVVTECIMNRKSTYFNQIKKMREVSNMAIRNAVQSERSESSLAISRLRESLYSEKEAACNKILIENEKLRADIKSLQDDLKKYGAGGEIEINYQLKLNAQKEMYEQDKILKENMEKSERIRFREEAAHVLETSSLNYKLQMETQQRHDEEMRDLLVKDRSRLEEECVKLREQLMQSLSQISLEKEKSNVKLADLKRCNDQELQEIHVNNIKLQSKVKEQFSKQLQHEKEENNKRQKEFELFLNKERDSLNTTNATELERIVDRHKLELKRVQAHLEVHHRDDIVKIKHIHEQEISRLLRDNDRMRRIIARSGTNIGAGDKSFQTRQSNIILSPQNQEKKIASNNNKKSNKIKNAVNIPSVKSFANSPQPGHMYNFNSNDADDDDDDDDDSMDGIENEIPKPSPPPPSPSIRTNATSKLNWGSLTESLALQESGATYISTKNKGGSPPNDFQLEVAIESEHGNFDNRISDNAKKVGSYMGTLQAYIDEGRYDSSNNNDNDSINELGLSDLANLPLGMTMRSKGFDSDFNNEFNQSASDDDSVLFGENIVLNLSNSMQ